MAYCCKLDCITAMQTKANFIFNIIYALKQHQICPAPKDTQSVLFYCWAF